MDIAYTPAAICKQANGRPIFEDSLQDRRMREAKCNYLESLTQYLITYCEKRIYQACHVLQRVVETEEAGHPIHVQISLQHGEMNLG